jgi:hypothetical protein
MNELKANIEKHSEELKETNFQNTFQKQPIQQMGEKPIPHLTTHKHENVLDITSHELKSTS